MEKKVCDWCRKPIEKVDKKKETEGGVYCELKMKGNARIREFPFSKTFDVNTFCTLCDDCAEKSIYTFVQCGQECIATRKPSEMNGKGE